MGTFTGYKPYKYLMNVMETGHYGYPQDISDETIEAGILGRDYICIDVTEGNLSSPASDDLYKDGDTSWLSGSATKRLAHYSLENELNVNGSLYDLRFYLRSILQTDNVITPGGTGEDAVEDVVVEAGNKTPKSFVTVAGYYQGESSGSMTINSREVRVYGHQINTMTLEGSADDGTLKTHLESIYGQFDEHAGIRSSEDTSYIPDDTGNVLTWGNIQNIVIRQANNDCVASGTLSELAGNSGKIAIKYNRNLDKDTASLLGGGIFTGAKSTGDDGYNVETTITLNKNANQSSQLQEIFFGQEGSTSFKTELQSGAYLEIDITDNYGGLCKLIMPRCSLSMDGSRTLGGDEEASLVFTTDGSAQFTIEDQEGTEHSYTASAGAYFYMQPATTAKITCIELNNTGTTNIELDVARVDSTPFWNRSWILKDLEPGDDFKFRLPVGGYQYTIRKAGSDADVGPCTLTLTQSTPASIVLPLNACYSPTLSEED